MRIGGASRLRNYRPRGRAGYLNRAVVAEPVSVELGSQVIDPTRDYFDDLMVPPHLPTNMSEPGRALCPYFRFTPKSGH